MGEGQGNHSDVVGKIKGRESRLFLSNQAWRTTYLPLMFRFLAIEVRVRSPFLIRLAAAFVLFVTPLAAADVWSGAPFSADPVALRLAADAVKAGQHQPVTVLLDDLHFAFDEAGRCVESNHMIYRIEDQDGIENWADTSGQWEAWHQSKPEIKARVITAEGAVHWIDPKTLNDVPVHENAPDLYTDERRYGGPLPAIAIGAVVEQEVVVRDNAPLFAAGVVYRWGLGWSVPIKKTHFVISHPDAQPLHYEVHLLPEASVIKSHENGSEIITVDQGPLPGFQEQPDHVPFDVVLRPEIEFSTGTSWRQVASVYAVLARETEPQRRFADRDHPPDRHHPAQKRSLHRSGIR